MGLFGTAGIRGLTSETVTPENAVRIGQAAGVHAKETDGSDTIVVGRDGRTTSSGILHALKSGLMSTGIQVRDIGEVPTPVLAYASRHKRGIMVTASHNPPEYNGIKFFVHGREYARSDEARLEELFEKRPTVVGWDEWSAPISCGVVSDYRKAVKRYAEQYGESIDAVSVAVDCGNGMAGHATPQVLTDLGARVVGVNANVDGFFPGRGSKPSDESLEAFLGFIQGGEFDFGLAHDGDADRIVLLNNVGEIIHEDTVLAILAEQYVQESSVGDPVVVTTPNASTRVDERVKIAGGRVIRTGLGNLQGGISEVRGSNQTQVVFAAEPWKHIHPEFGWWIDGIVSAAVLARLVAEAGSLDSLRENIEERPYEKQSVHCPDDEKDRVMAELAKVLPEEFEEIEMSSEYGIRLTLGDNSWILIRPSGTEPVIRVYCESERVNHLLERAVRLINATVNPS